MAIVLAGSVLFSLGGAFMRASQGFTRPGPSLVVACTFVLGAMCLARAVRHHNLSTTMLIGLGSEAIGAVVLGVFVMGERLTAPQVGGILLVLSGVLILRS
jgi:multidrug transporter EmrE-like cation transporter